MKDSLSDLFELADAYCVAKGISESTLSGQMLKGGNRLRDLRTNGADIGVRRLREAVRWFAVHWPIATPWPAGIERPALVLAEDSSSEGPVQ